MAKITAGVSSHHQICMSVHKANGNTEGQTSAIPMHTFQGRVQHVVIQPQLWAQTAGNELFIPCSKKLN